MAKELKYPYPSRFGSHASMVMLPCDIEESNEQGLVTIQDEFGTYQTFVERLDNGLADPNRYVESRLGKLFEKRTVEKIS